MSQITIQCRLIASPETRQQLWTLMMERNTPLINALIEQISQYPEFETWRRKGKISSAVVSQLCKSLKTEPRFSGQPARFYASAQHVADYIFKSWLSIQKRLQQKLDGKSRWLEILRSDEELVQESGVQLSKIRDRASKILAQLTIASAADKAIQEQQDERNIERAKSTDRRLVNQLFTRYQKSKCLLDQCAIAYLLKNGCKVPDKEENPTKFFQYRRKVEIQIEKLRNQIEARLPKGRDLTGQSWLETLAIATTTVPKDNAEARRWQNRLITKSSILPFPLIFETNEDLVWSCKKDRICVRFNGLRDHSFKIYCDQRQLHWFQRFFEDQQTKRMNKNQHSSGLLTLRSARLAWQECEGKGNPWDVHRLTLYCTVDTRLWTTEGTEQVRQEKAAEVAKKITQMESKGDLLETQQAYIKRLNSTLARIETSFDRPSKPLYQGLSNIIVGLCLGLEKPATIAVWDAQANQVLAHYGVRQLLGENYRLLARRRSEQQKTAHQRHKAQKRANPKQAGESELGQYIDRLLAKAIVAIAKTYKAGSIAIPKLGDIRQIIEAEIQSKAEQKCPGYLEGQQRYAKQYRISVHRWSYGRLVESIQSQAAKFGILIEEAKQPLIGKLEERARDVAIAAYQSRAQ